MGPLWPFLCPKAVYPYKDFQQVQRAIKGFWYAIMENEISLNDGRE
jgi:formylmethanofuran dehydrogenase subunit A